MKANRIQQAVSEGRMPLGHMLMEFATRGIAKICESAELDFVLIDMEHSGFDLDKVADVIAWFKATPIAPLVRIPDTDYHWIARLMDAGALGIMVPNVQSVEQARRALSAMKYAPWGRRGLGLGTAHNDYLPPKPSEYLNHANQNTTLICQIESVAGVEAVEEIAALEGVDVLWPGHFDLSSSMGITGEIEHPKLVEALKRVVKAANAHGKLAGIQPQGQEQAQAWIDLGYRMISLGADITVYGRALRGALADLRKIQA